MSDKWRLVVTITTPNKTWQQVYEGKRPGIRSWRWASGFAAGYACAKGIPPEQVSMKVEKWIDYDDGHSGGYPHWCSDIEEDWPHTAQMAEG